MSFTLTGPLGLADLLYVTEGAVTGVLVPQFVVQVALVPTTALSTVPTAWSFTVAV